MLLQWVYKCTLYTTCATQELLHSAMLLRLKRQMNLSTWTTTTTAAGLPTLEVSPLRKRSTSLVVKNKEFEKLSAGLHRRRNRKSVVELPELAFAKSTSPSPSPGPGAPCAANADKHRLERPHSSMGSAGIPPDERLVQPVKKFSCSDTPHLVPRPPVATLRSGPTSPLALYSRLEAGGCANRNGNGVLGAAARAEERVKARSRQGSGNEAARRGAVAETKARSVTSSHSSLCPPHSPFDGRGSPTRSPSSLSTESLSPEPHVRALSTNSSHGYTSHTSQNTSLSCSPRILGATETIVDEHDADAFAFDDAPDKVLTSDAFRVHCRKLYKCLAPRSLRRETN